MSENNGKISSPQWSSTQKLVVALTTAAVFFVLFVRFQNILGPLLFAFVLAYLLYPLAARFRAWTRLPWRLVVSLLYILIWILLIGVLTAGGFALVDQMQSLIKFLQVAVVNIPTYLEQLSTQSYSIGPFQFDFQHLDINAVAQQALSAVQPLLSQAGSLVGTFATSAASGFGWLLFILLVSYFVLYESRGFRGQIVPIKIPGYEQDLTRLGTEFSRIWNAFLRGQIVIFFVTFVVYTILLGGLGVRFFIGLALIAGLARFIPYVGPFIAWCTYFLVAYFQSWNMFGLTSFSYALVVVGVAWGTDVIMDNFVSPRLMSDVLEVHPAAVMVSALVGASLFGVVGVVLAAPVLASVKLLFEYISCKLLDLNPWEVIRTKSLYDTRSSWVIKLQVRFQKWVSQILGKIKNREK
jgi:predicted PurR-regulated permease PerM